MWSSVNPSLCTHISYAFVNLANDGTIQYGADISQFLALRNSHPNVKLLISFGGQYAPSATFEAVSSNPTARSKFVSEVLTYIETNRIHGGKK